MDVRMVDLGPAPGVEGRDPAGLRIPEPALLAQQLAQGRCRDLEQQVPHRPGVPPPEKPELLRNREDQVVVVRGQEKLPLGVQPRLQLALGALRARAMTARVVPDPFDVPVRAPLRMTAQCRRPTLDQRSKRSMGVTR